MSLLFENDAKEILKRNGISVPIGCVAHSGVETVNFGAEHGFPLVIKALVPSGKKKRLGGIIVAENEEEAGRATPNLIGSKIGHFEVDSVYVEKFFNTSKEFFVSVFIDNLLKLPSVFASSAGGVDVEELTQSDQASLVRRDLHPLKGLQVYEAVEIGVDVGLKGKMLREFSSLLMRLYHIFEGYDLKLLEINPLSLSPEGDFCGVGVLINIDDDALSRHPEIAGIRRSDSDRFWRPPTELEKRVVEADQKDPYRGTARYTEIDGGEIGFVGGGGGGSLMLFDALNSKGLKPANYSEIGGNPPQEKVYQLTKVVLSKPGIQGFFMGTPITNNTQVDILAKGITRAFKDLSVDTDQFPVVIRTAGVNNEEAKRIFEENGVSFFGRDTTLPEAVEIMAKKMNEKKGLSHGHSVSR